MSNTAPEPLSTPAVEGFDSQCDLPVFATVIDRSFLTAHLLTGNATQAEMAVLRAINSWNPGDEGASVLFHRSLREAAEMMSRHSSSQDQSSGADSYLPHELRGFLALPSALRIPIVLRFLAGVPAEACAEMLDDTERAAEFSFGVIRDSR